jgi:tripartite-type tricarboxylate transporter receptor subunit TctC
MRAGHACMPDIPTSEVGLSLLSDAQWLGFFAPKGTPRDIIDKLNAVVTSDSAVRSRIQEFGSGSFRRDQQTPEAIAAIEKAGVEEWVADHESGREQSGAKRVGKKFGDRQRVGRFSN